jgi:para-aminobenzoate synthetase component 1
VPSGCVVNISRRAAAPSNRLRGLGVSGDHPEGRVPFRVVRAWFDGVLAEEVVERHDDPGVLERGGWWAVVLTFEGALRLYRFARVTRSPLPTPAADWRGPAPGEWASSLDEATYRSGVEEIRRRIRDGEVYQANLCRVLSAPVPAAADPWALAVRLAHGNPAPFAGVVDVPAVDAHPGDRIVCASPELYLRRDGRIVTSSPIKGTARDVEALLPKDHAENVMIVDLVRNDLQRVCVPGSVEVTGLLRVEAHPGLVHLVSTVQGRLVDGAGWPELLAATAPPGSVSGAPKSSALRAIADLEPVPRGPYCGGIGWIDADAGTGCLAVGIRSFWWDGDRLCFGTGAGITWGSDPGSEWQETRLKAGRLTALASSGPGPAGSTHGRTHTDRGTDGDEELRWPETV